MTAREVLDDVLLGELVTVYRRHKLLEFLHGLLPKVPATNEEEETLCACVFDEAVDELDRRKCFSRAGGHLDESARPPVGKGFFPTARLIRPAQAKAVSRRRWEFAKLLGPGLLLRQPGEQVSGR